MITGTSNGTFHDETLLSVRRATALVDGNAIDMALTQHYAVLRIPHDEVAAAHGPRSLRYGSSMRAQFHIERHNPCVSLKDMSVESDG
jgi:hypothetical protein